MKASYALAQLTALPLAPPALIGVAAQTGYQFVGLRLTEVTRGGDHFALHADRALMRETLAAIRDTGVGVLDVELIRLSPEVDVAAFEPVIAAAAEIGARHLLTQGADADRARVIDAFGRVCDLAARYGLTADVEFPSWNRGRVAGRRRRVGARSGSAERRGADRYPASAPIGRDGGGCRRPAGGMVSLRTAVRRAGGDTGYA